MISADRLSVIRGRGVTDDRYALGIGAYSSTEPAKDRHLTLITQDAIQIAEAWQQAAGLSSFSAAMTRRNVLLDGISASELNAWVDRQFWIGEVLCEGVEWCTPCHRPSELSGIPGFADAFADRGGLRARVLGGGTIEIGVSCGPESVR